MIVKEVDVTFQLLEWDWRVRAGELTRQIPRLHLIKECSMFRTIPDLGCMLHTRASNASVQEHLTWVVSRSSKGALEYSFYRFLFSEKEVILPRNTRKRDAQEYWEFKGILSCVFEDIVDIRLSNREKKLRLRY